MKPKTCEVEECVRIAIARGWCGTHYERWRKYGSPLGTSRPQTFADAFARYTTPNGCCLVWIGYLNENGYGRMAAGGEQMYAHRYAWEQVNGPIPPGAIIDHMCHNRACVNAAHLRIATRRENAWNLSGPRIDNGSSGARGVSPNHGRWQARVRKDGINHYLGTYDTVVEAQRVADHARRVLFGEFAGEG